MDKTREDIEVSIISTGKDVEKTIGNLMNSLLNQVFTKRYEIIYVDGGSTDKTLQLIRNNYKSELENGKIKIINAKGTNPAQGRNIGARYAKGKFLAFIDADCEAPNNWLKRLYLIYNDQNKRKEKIGAVGATLIPHPKTSKTNKIIHKIVSSKLVSGGSVQFTAYKQNKKVSSIPAGNFFIPKEIFNEIGGFNESLRYCEDMEINLRLRQNGYNIYYAPKAEVYHLREFNSIIEYTRYIYNYGKGYGKSLKVNPKLMTFSRLGILLWMLLLFFGNLAILLYPNGISYFSYTTIISNPISLFKKILFNISNPLSLLYLATLITNALLVIYFIMSLILGIKLSIGEKNIIYIVYAPLVMSITHIFYLMGLLVGIFTK